MNEMDLENPRAGFTTMRRPRVVAHRGASDVAPENTIPAIKAALAAGADMVEVDVQRTSDGIPVVLHDTTLARTTDVAQRIARHTHTPIHQLPFAAVRGLDAGAWRGKTFVGTTVPTLEEVLDTLRATGVGLLLEIKSPKDQPGLVEAVAEVVDRFGTGVDVVVQSFHGPSLRTFGRLLPRVPRGLLCRSTPAQPALEAWVDAVNPWHASVDSAYVRRAQLAGLHTYVWTANTRRAITRAADAGVEGIITDRPERALRLLRRRTGVAA